MVYYHPQILTRTWNLMAIQLFFKCLFQLFGWTKSLHGKWLFSCIKKCGEWKRVSFVQRPRPPFRLGTNLPQNPLFAASREEEKLGDRVILRCCNSAAGKRWNSSTCATRGRGGRFLAKLHIATLGHGPYPCNKSSASPVWLGGLGRPLICCWFFHHFFLRSKRCFLASRFVFSRLRRFIISGFGTSAWSSFHRLRRMD